MDAKTPVSLQSLFKHVEDPRGRRGRRHRLEDILLIAVCACLGGADDVAGIAAFGQGHREWFERWRAWPHGIPARDTFNRVLRWLAPQPLELLLQEWLQSLRLPSGPDVVAIDGKTLRRSQDRRHEIPALHRVSAWATTQGLTLGQVAVESKSNEITAIPRLLALLDLQGCIVTIDAMGTQTEIAQALRAQEADYVLALKGNQGHLQDAVQDTFALAHAAAAESPDTAGWDLYQTVNGGHGRIETRQCRVIGDPDILAYVNPTGTWRDLQSLIEVTSLRRQDAQVTTEVRYFISSCPPQAQPLLTAIRGHWGIENSLHWVLDVAFREDECRLRKGHAPHNMAVLRRLTHTLLRQNTSTKLGIANKRRLAGWNLAYMEEILGM